MALTITSTILGCAFIAFYAAPDAPFVVYCLWALVNGLTLGAIRIVGTGKDEP
jgi:hypothetical protein